MRENILNKINTGASPACYCRAVSHPCSYKTGLEVIFRKILGLDFFLFAFCIIGLQSASTFRLFIFFSHRRWKIVSCFNGSWSSYSISFSPETTCPYTVRLTTELWWLAILTQEYKTCPTPSGQQSAYPSIYSPTVAAGDATPGVHISLTPVCCPLSSSSPGIHSHWIIMLESTSLSVLFNISFWTWIYLIRFWNCWFCLLLQIPLATNSRSTVTSV